MKNNCKRLILPKAKTQRVTLPDDDQCREGLEVIDGVGIGSYPLVYDRESVKLLRMSYGKPLF